MRNRTFKLLAFVFLTFLVKSSFAQLTGCQNAQNACSNPSFVLTSNAGSGLPSGLNISNPTTNPQQGNGANPNAFPNSGCLLSNGPGPNWMIITVGSSGLLAFSFGASTPTSLPQSGFYDWAMWPYDPNTTCNAIFANQLAPIACCWNAQSSGGTGMGAPTPSALSSSGQPLPAGVPGNFQPSIPVTAGQQFIILLSNYSGVTTNVSINGGWQAGTAGLTCSPLLLPSFIRCPGQPAAMTATWATVATNISYSLTTGVGIYTVQSNPTFIVAPTSTQVYTVSASGYNASLASVVTASNTFTVIISPTTTMNVVASPNPSTMPGVAGNVCYNTPATFTAVSPGTNFTLTSSTGAVINSNIQVVSTPPLQSGGVYTLATTLFSGCTATGAVNVNVAPNSQIQLPPPINVCLGDPINLTSTLTAGTNFQWVSPSGSVTAGSSAINIGSSTLSDGGVYTVGADISYNGILCHRTATLQVNVVATSSPIISASPSKTLCQGSSLILNTSISGSAGFLWQGPNGYNVSSQSTTVSAILPNNAGIYTVTAIFSNGAISCLRKSNVVIDVVATSVPTINLIPHNICQHDTARLGVITSIPADAVLWSGPNNFSSTLSNPVIPDIQPYPSNVYGVTAYYHLGSQNCPVSTSDQINVVQVSTVSVIPPAAVCRPDNVPLFASAPQAIGYTWQGPNNYLDYQATPVLFHPQTDASGTYTVTVAFGGGALVCYNRATVTVTINPSLTFSLTPFYQACYNKPIQINGPAGATSYSWTSSSGFTSNLQNVSLPHIEAPDEGTYTLSVSLGPCITTHTAYLDVIERIQEVFAQQSTTICKGDSVTLKSEVTGGNGNEYGFIWTPSIYLNSPNVGVQAGVKPQGTTIYNVQAYDPICAEYKTSHTFTVTVLTAAKPYLTLASNVGCEPFTQLYNSKVPRGSIVTYDFAGSNGYSKRVQNDSINISLLSAGTYSLKVKTATLHEESDRVCADSTLYPATIIVNPKPGSDFSWYPETPTLSENEVTFMGSTRQKTIQSRKWSFNGTYNDTSDAATQERLFQYTGKYAVTLISTTDEGCMDTVTKYIEIKDDFNVFIPNSFTPNGDNLNDVFQMKGSGIRQEAFSMDIFDRWGSVLFSTKDPAKGWDGTLKGQQMAGEGVYVYKIKLSGANGEGKKEYVGQVTLIR